ncbi:hypothetical protein ACIO13_21115 [Streptomyces sp. NPDC087425]|uniref:hypothetical protein n=1 Tax=Streptomyces sp. NPDC087425 TaxID=3365787 RepID=UPI00380DC07B
MGPHQRKPPDTPTDGSQLLPVRVSTIRWAPARTAGWAVDTWSAVTFSFDAASR